MYNNARSVRAETLLSCFKHTTFDRLGVRLNVILLYSAIAPPF